MSKSSLEAAAEAAARVNAMLIAKGKLKLPPNQMKPKIEHLSGERIADDLVTAEVEINDAPLGARNLLTRGHTQDEICKYSGAAISTRGRYLTFDDKLHNSSGDRPLYLHVQAPKQESVNLAVSRILEMIAQYDKNGAIKIPVTNLASTTSKRLSESSIVLPPIASSGMHFVQEKVFIGLEAPYSFIVREKILGPGGSYLQHIKTETGACVTLRGRGSDYIEPTSGREAFEPLYIHLTHPKPEGLQAAKVLAMNLVDTVHAEYAQWEQQQQPILPMTIGPAQIAYHPIAPGSVTFPQVPVLPMSEVQNFSTLVSSAPLILNANQAHLLHSSVTNIVPASFKPNYMNSFSTNPVSSISTIPSIFENPIFTTPSFAPPMDNSIVTSPEAPASNLLSAFNPRSAIITSIQPELHILPLSKHPNLPQEVGLDCHQTSPIQVTPFNTHLRLTNAASNPVMFPSLAPAPVQPPNLGLSMYSHFRCEKLEENQPSKRKFMEEPDTILNNGLQDQMFAGFPSTSNILVHSIMPPPPLPMNLKGRVQLPFKMPKAPTMPRSVSGCYAAKRDALSVEVNGSNKKLKATETEKPQLRKGALGGLAMIYGSDDSDDDYSSPVGSPTTRIKHQ